MGATLLGHLSQVIDAKLGKIFVQSVNDITTDRLMSVDRIEYLPYTHAIDCNKSQPSHRQSIHSREFQLFELIKRVVQTFAPSRVLTIPGGLVSSGVPVASARLPFPTLQKRMNALILDCGDGQKVERLRFKIAATHSPRELWQLRSDVYSLLGTLQNQAEATRRVNSLLPSFEGWLPERQLKRIE